ncbi:MAG: type II toxin-antitoxin system RelE/ParE family toxin [Xenococcaceae cyanobacterium]
MAYKVIWSDKAVEDVDAIATYIARDSPSYAAAVVQKIVDATQDLSNCPLAGSILLEFGESTIREQLAYSYRIIYRIQDEIITIAAVIYGKRLLDLEL